MKGTDHYDLPVLDDEDKDDEYAMWLVVVRALRHVFPHIDVEEISRFEPLTDEIELTSADFAAVLAAVTQQTGVVVPEQDYPLVATLDGLEQYLRSRVPSLTA